jgi:hypothetical protein
MIGIKEHVLHPAKPRQTTNGFIERSSLSDRTLNFPRQPTQGNFSAGTRSRHLPRQVDSSRSNPLFPQMPPRILQDVERQQAIGINRHTQGGQLHRRPADLERLLPALVLRGAPGPRRSSQGKTQDYPPGGPRGTGSPRAP